MQQAQPAILTINCGSSSLKFALFTCNALTTLLASAHIDHIGSGNSRLLIKDDRGGTLADEQLSANDMNSAANELVKWVHRSAASFTVKAIGHRIVQGGMHHVQPEMVDQTLLDSLTALVPLAPEHLPSSLAVIAIFRESFPSLPQIACFDTAFHRSMPFEAQYYALPRELWEDGLVRYGFHGLSYEYIIRQLEETRALKKDQQIIIAHLGNGASMAAIRNGQSMATTMGLTPAGGLVMSSRCGDLDPGVIVYLLKEKKMTVDQVNKLINEGSGLKAVSGTDGDIQHLLEKQATDPHAAEAVSMFCYHARKFVGSLAAACGGVDLLVFTGGIGEHAAIIRERICEGLAFMGIRIDKDLNSRHEEIISYRDSPVTVRIMKANEEKMIAIHAWQWMEKHNR